LSGRRFLDRRSDCDVNGRLIAEVTYPADCDQCGPPLRGPMRKGKEQRRIQAAPASELHSADRGGPFPEPSYNGRRRNACGTEATMPVITVEGPRIADLDKKRQLGACREKAAAKIDSAPPLL
jgi:hypothetical protein